MLEHPEDTMYHAVRTTSNVDATPLADIWPEKYGDISTGPSDNLAVLLDSSTAGVNWATLIIETPKLAEYTFTGGDRPAYLDPGCEDLDFTDAETLVGSVGWNS